MKTEKYYCLLLSLLSVVTITITAMVMFDNNFQAISLRECLLFGFFVALVSSSNVIFYRLLKEQYSRQEMI
jgi:hypothetical protein